MKKIATQHSRSRHIRLYRNLQLRILTLVVGSMVIVLGCNLFGMYWQDRQDIKHDVNARVMGARRVLASHLAEDAAMLSAFQHFISANERLQAAWLSKNRNDLFRQASAIFERIHSSNRVTHFYFVDLDQVCFLRVHNPTRFGDTIHRDTMNEAARSGKTTSGIELGKFGHFTLRVVQPWMIDGELVGYIELGEEIEHITPKLSEVLGVEVVFAIEKQYLDRPQWEEGLALKGLAGDWNQLSNFVVIDKTIGNVPPELAALIDSGRRDDTRISFTEPSTESTYCGGVVPLIDAGKRQVGSLVIMKNVTRQIEKLQMVAGTLLVIGFVVSGALFAVCCVYVTSLREVSEQLVAAARQAGKAEIATSVLHNVGNVLNSVNVSAGLIQDKVLGSGAGDLTKAIDVMKDHLDDIGDYVSQDERGKHLPRFLIDASQQMCCEEEVILGEVRSLISNIDHIKAVVASQQQHAKGNSGIAEEISLVDLLEDAIHINTASMERHAVKITREFDDVGLVVADRQAVLQIIVNLISNAKYACMESGHEEHQLTVRLRRTAEECVAIEVQDNGKGIAAENLTKIFAHGFTTRKEGHGFGLHSAVLAAEELGGHLAASSDGPGTGATFTLEIPCERAGVSPCTA